MGKNSKKQPQRNVKIQNKHNLIPEKQELKEKVDQLLKLSTSISQPTIIKKALDNHCELSSLIDKIKNLELKKSISDNGEGSRCTPEKLESFSKWLKANGAIFDGSSIAEFPGYDLGLKADIDIPYASLFIAVPRKLMMTVEGAKKTMLKKYVEKDQLLKNMPNVTLAIYLLVEKFKENSFYKPYIDILPKSYPTILYFSKEELEVLKGSPTLEVALRQIRSVARQYAYFHTLFSNNDDSVSRLLKPHFTYQEYCWAVSTVMTRQNMIPSDNGETKVSALIPLWDLCNHTNGMISTDYNPELNRSECLALRDFKKDEQLFIFYGPRTNAEFFIHNGFIPNNNEYDSYFVRLGISKCDPLRDKRTILLKKLDLENTQEFKLSKGENPINGKLLAFLRIFNMNEGQLDHWIKSNKPGDLEYIECALDVSLEKKSWTFLQTRLKLLLATYQTSLEQDKILLNESKLSHNTQLAINMRASEKEIIWWTLNWLEQHVRQ